MSISTHLCRRMTCSKGWLDEAVAFVKTLPVKAAGGAKPKKPRGPTGQSM
jgi:hypothetical protein